VRVLPALVALALLLAAPAAHGATLTVTGTDGRDNLEIDFEGSANALVITPALTLSGDLSCSTESDPLTGRALRHRCPKGATNVALTVDLRRGVPGEGTKSVSLPGPPMATTEGLLSNWSRSNATTP